MKDIERALQDQKLVNKVLYDLDNERNFTIGSNNEYSASDLLRDSTRFVLAYIWADLAEIEPATKVNEFWILPLLARK